MLDLRDRYFLTKCTIETSDSYEENFELFNEGIEILENKISNEDYSEFTPEERDILEEIFIIINYEEE